MRVVEVVLTTDPESLFQEGCEEGGKGLAGYLWVLHFYAESGELVVCIYLKFPKQRLI